jgi:hypothetical protein
MAVQEKTNNKSEYEFVFSPERFKVARWEAKSRSGRVSEIVSPATQKPRAIEA